MTATDWLTISFSSSSWCWLVFVLTTWRHDSYRLAHDFLLFLFVVLTCIRVNDLALGRESSLSTIAVPYSFFL